MYDVVCSGTYDAIFCWRTFQLKYCLGIYLIVLAVLYADKYSNIGWLIGVTLGPHFVWITNPIWESKFAFEYLEVEYLFEAMIFKALKIIAQRKKIENL